MNVNYNELAVNLELKPAKTKNVTRIPVKCRQRNQVIPIFLISVGALSILSLIYLEIDWGNPAFLRWEKYFGIWRI